MSDIIENFDDEFLPDEHELKKEVSKFKRELKKQDAIYKKATKTAEHIHQARINNQQLWYEDQISTLRAQIQTLLEKNMELGDACKVFAKGIENLKKDYRTVTTHHASHIRDKDDLIKKMTELTQDPLKPGRRIVATTVTKTNSYGQTVEVVISTEHTEKIKTSINAQI